MSDESSTEIIAVTAACFERLLNRVTQLKQVRLTWPMSPKLSTPEHALKVPNALILGALKWRHPLHLFL